MLTLSQDVLSWMIALLFFAFGATLGSFLMLVADRLPRGESIVLPPSHCDSCGAPVRWYGLIPVLGWALARGKCPSCGANFSPVYALVELAVGLATVWTCFFYASPLDYLLAIQALVSQGTPHLVFGVLRYEQLVLLMTALLLLYSAVPLSVIDIRHRILPNRITIPGALVGLLVGAANPKVGWLGAVAGLVVGGGGLYAVAKLYSLLRSREGMGMGDVKYLAMLGAILGWQGVVVCIALASLLGALWGIGAGLVRREGLQASIPFGPFLAVAAIFVHLFSHSFQSYLFYAT